MEVRIPCAHGVAPYLSRSPLARSVVGHGAPASFGVATITGGCDRNRERPAATDPLGYAPPVLREADTSTPERLVIETTLTAVDPTTVTDHFTDPALPTGWGAGEAQIDSGTGRHTFRWPEPGGTLRGRFLEQTPGRCVSFSWRWDDAADLPERTATVTTKAVPEGTLLTLTHLDYTAADQGERADHLAGWAHFIGRLAARLD